MEKSVKKMLGIYSLVIFCSVLMSNTLFVSSSKAQLLNPTPAAPTVQDFMPQGGWAASAFNPVIPGIQTTNNASTVAAKSEPKMRKVVVTDAMRKKYGFGTSYDKEVLLGKLYSGKSTADDYEKAKAWGMITEEPVPLPAQVPEKKEEVKKEEPKKAEPKKEEPKKEEEKKEEGNGSNPAVQSQSASSANSGGGGSGGSGSEKFDGAGSYKAPVGGAYCKNTTNVFETIACKIITTLDDLRIVIYILAGFGLIAFAFSAIFGKVSWKHLGQLGFGLFLVSMMAPFITYFTHPSDDGYKIKYGDYLPAGDFKAEFARVGVSTVAQTECEKEGTADGSRCLSDVIITEKAPKGSWSLKDLKGTVQSAIKTVQAAHSTVQATKAAVKEVKAQAQLVSGAIKNSGGGVNGLLNIAGAVSNAGASLGQVGYTLGNNIQYNVATAANSYQDSFLTNEQRAYNEKQRAAGNQTNNLAATISDKQSGIVKKGDNFYDASGKKVLVKANEQGQFVNAATGEVIGDKVDAQGNLVTASKFSNLVSNAEKAREYGMKGGAALTSASNDSQNMNNMVGGIGGGFLGNVAGLVTLGASATGNLVDADSQIKNNAQAKKEAQGTQAASISGVKSDVTDKQGNKTVKYNDGTEEKKNKDGSTSIKYPDGRIVEKTKTGAIIEKQPDGSFVSKQKDGSITQVSADGSGAKVDKNGKLVSETQDGFFTAIYDNKGNKTELIRSDGGYVSLDENGKVVSAYDNLGKPVKLDKVEATETPALATTTPPIVDQRTAEEKAIVGDL